MAPCKDKPMPDPGWLPFVLLLGLVAGGWCAAMAIRSPADFSRPANYLDDPEKSDIFAVYAGLEANAAGENPPFLWKTVSRLNAPQTANWNDWPSLEELHGGVLLILSRLFGVFGGLNAALLLGHLLAAATFFGVARASGVNSLWSFVGGLAYGLAPFLFAQSPHHSGVQWAWHVPLFTLVWRWVSIDPGLEPWSRRFREATGIGLLTGLLNVYYANIFCQLTLVGGAVRFLRTRARPPLLAALAVIAATAIGFAVSHLDTLTFKAVHGSNDGVLVREYKWLEIYGLKLKDLFIPPVRHRSDVFRDFGIEHRKQAVLNDEDGSPYQGLIGLACLLWLAGTTVGRMADGRSRAEPIEAWWLLWIVLMFTTGGLNAILGAAGFTMFRTGARYSIVILAISLLWAARRLTAIQTGLEAAHPGQIGAAPWVFAAAAACGLILWDQVPRPPTAEAIAAIELQVAADREFAERIEAAVPAGGMVFQLPVMEFPESPLPGVPPYDHFRPYLFSKRLRFSFGTHKGRPQDAWQQALQAKFFEGATLDQEAGMIRVNRANAKAAIEKLKKLGFAAVYVNRNGFPDRGRGIEDAFLDLGFAEPPIRNATGDLACILLE